MDIRAYKRHARSTHRIIAQPTRRCARACHRHTPVNDAPRRAKRRCARVANSVKTTQVPAWRLAKFWGPTFDTSRAYCARPTINGTSRAPRGDAKIQDQAIEHLKQETTGEDVTEREEMHPNAWPGDTGLTRLVTERRVERRAARATRCARRSRSSEQLSIWKSCAARLNHDDSAFHEPYQ